MKLFCYTVAMKFSLSSSYFAGRRYTPDVMVAQTVALGFDAVELGYFTREVELDAWQMALAREGVSVSSIHAFCPMPLEMPQLGPEVFSLAAPEHEERQAAIRAMLRTLEAAVRFGARAVVTHGGRVELREPARLFGRRPYRSRLSQSLEQLGFVDESLVERERVFRESAAPKWLDAVSFSLEVLLPHFEAAGVTLAFENLPGIEAFPDPAECAFLRERFPSTALAAWYDIGHGERKARTGDWPVQETLSLTYPFTVGVHIHDVRGLEEDHCAPGDGTVDFRMLLPLLKKEGLIRVFEPSPNVSTAALQSGLQRIRTLLE